MSVKIGFDIGGTSMRVASVSENGIGVVLKANTPQSPKEAALKLIALIHEAADGLPVEAIAGGCPGTIEKNNRILRNPNLEEWVGFELGSHIKEEFKDASLAIENDADLAGLGEATYGSGVDKKIIAYVGIGTGVGTTRIVSGVIDAHRFGFEAGHQILDVAAGTTLEETVGGRFVAEKYGMHPRDVPRREYDKLTPFLVAGLYNSILHWSPDVLILGGSMMNEENGFRVADVQAALERLPKHFPTLPEIKKASLGDSAGLHGARALLFL